MRIVTVLLAGCGAADAPEVTVDRDLGLEPVTENPFRSAELVLDVQEASFGLHEGLPDHFALRRTEPLGLSCTLGTVIWDRVDVDDTSVVEVDTTAIGAPTFRLLDTGLTTVELAGTFVRGPDGTCISDLPDELPARATFDVRVFAPVGMAIDKPCYADQDPVHVASSTWLPLEALALTTAQGDDHRPLNAGPAGVAPFPVEVRDTTGERLVVEPARDDFWDHLPGIRAPASGASDLVIEGPAGFSLQWDVVGANELDADVTFTYVGGGAEEPIGDGSVVDPRLDGGPRPWIVPAVAGLRTGGEALCGPVHPPTFTLSTSDPKVCPVARWNALDEVPAEIRAVTEDVWTAVSLLDVGPCTLTLSPPGASVTFDVLEP